MAANESVLVDLLRKACDEISRSVGSRFKGMVLFGSWARREANEYSDVDVLVVVDGLVGTELRAKIYKIISKNIERDVTLITMSWDDIRRKNFNLYSLTLNIVADGIVICDSGGVLERFISEGRRMIRKYKLERYRTPDGKYGWARSDGRPIAEVEV